MTEQLDNLEQLENSESLDSDERYLLENIRENMDDSADSFQEAFSTLEAFEKKQFFEVLNDIINDEGNSQEVIESASSVVENLVGDNSWIEIWGFWERHERIQELVDQHLNGWWSQTSRDQIENQEPREEIKEALIDEAYNADTWEEFQNLDRLSISRLETINPEIAAALPEDLNFLSLYSIKNLDAETAAYLPNNCDVLSLKWLTNLDLQTAEIISDKVNSSVNFEWLENLDDKVLDVFLDKEIRVRNVDENILPEWYIKNENGNIEKSGLFGFL